MDDDCIEIIGPEDDNTNKLKKDNQVEVIDAESSNFFTIAQNTSCYPVIFDDEVSEILDSPNKKTDTHQKQPSQTQNTSKAQTCADVIDLTECVNTTSHTTVIKPIPQSSLGNHTIKRRSNDFMDITEGVVGSSQPIKKNIIDCNIDLTQHSDDDDNNVVVTERLITGTEIQSMDLTQSCDIIEELPIVQISGIVSTSMDDKNILNEEAHSRYNTANLETKNYEESACNSNSKNIESSSSLSPSTSKVSSEGIKAKIPINGESIIKTDEVTPMDYENMTTPEINAELDKYGLKPFKRKKAIQLLTHLYNQTHPTVDSIEDLPSPSKRFKPNPPSSPIKIKSPRTKPEVFKSPTKCSKSSRDNKKVEKQREDDKIAAIDKENVHDVTSYVPNIRDIECREEDLVFQKREKAEDLPKFMDKKCVTVKIADNNGRIPENSGAPRNEIDIATNRASDQINGLYSELVELEQRALVANAEPFECGVCMCLCAAGAGAVLRECVHAFCRDCLSDLVKHAGEPVVGCPAMGCPGHLQEREIRALVTPQEYERWLARGLAAAETGTRNSFHCRTRDCTGWVLCDPGARCFPCPVCDFINCIPCQAIHEKDTCEQHKKKLQETASNRRTEERTRAHVDKLIAGGKAMECPECGVLIMKHGGCDSLICSACRTELCWATRGRRWGPRGPGDKSGGCRCAAGRGGKWCHPKCRGCH